MDPVAPGARRLYEFDVPEGSAGTYWYHPHAHGTTTLQVGMGLAAPLIVRAADDPIAAISEQVLMVTSIQLDSSARVQRPTMTMGGTGMMSGGGELLVNGQKLPVLSVAPGATQRWRILNATADRYLRIALDGHRFAVVGTDGGLLAQPIAGLAEWLLAPAQRVEIVVTISTRQGMQYGLRDLGYGSGMMGMSGSTLMTVATSRATARAPVALPATLRPATILGPSTFRQQVVLSSAGMMGMAGSFLINGRTFDMDRVDLQTLAGRVETWDFVNTTAMDHPMHIHGTQFQVVGATLGGVAGPVADAAWFDTVNVPAGRTVSIRTRQGSPGKRMFHCHILPHEDAGMMAVLEVLPG
jgi:bilirubin oxidase